MKTLEFLYQETEIHFLVNPNDENVMVNATEMAKLFNKRVDVFLKTNPTKRSIELLEFPPTGVNLNPIPKEKIIKTNHRYGTFFHRELAIEFAMWLDPVFKRWIINKIDEIVFGNLKKYKDAMAKEVRLKKLTPTLKQNLIDNPTKENVKAFFDNEENISKVKKEKNKASTNQLNMFRDFYKEKESNNAN